MCFEVWHVNCGRMSEEPPYTGKGKMRLQNQTNTSLVSLNRSQLVSGVEGDLELLTTLVELFGEECPKSVGTIQRAVISGNPRDIEHAAHAIKGMLRALAGEASGALAERLEQMGRSGDTAGCATIQLELEAAVALFQSELTTFLEKAKMGESLESLL